MSGPIQGEHYEHQTPQNWEVVELKMCEICGRPFCRSSKSGRKHVEVPGGYVNSTHFDKAVAVVDRGQKYCHTCLGRMLQPPDIAERERYEDQFPNTARPHTTLYDDVRDGLPKKPAGVGRVEFEGKLMAALAHGPLSYAEMSEVTGVKYAWNRLHHYGIEVEAVACVWPRSDFGKVVMKHQIVGERTRLGKADKWYMH